MNVFIFNAEVPYHIRHIMLTLLVCQNAYAQEEGIASYYADFFVGRTMANGQHIIQKNLLVPTSQLLWAV
jgi:rare lipoprotein A (peptidoglycan hydrolase)